MKLDQIILGFIIFGAAIYVVALIASAIFAFPWGLLALIPVGIVLTIIGVVIYQRIHNKEDDYYEKNIDK